MSSDRNSSACITKERGSTFHFHKKLAYKFKNSSKCVGLMPHLEFTDMLFSVLFVDFVLVGLYFLYTIFIVLFIRTT